MQSSTLRSACLKRAKTFMRFLLGAPLLVTCMFLLAASPGPGQDKIDVKVVKYAGLVDIVNQSKGKVIVVDFWAHWCDPCRAEFPHLVELNEKYAKQGLVAVSVSFDEPKDKAKVLKFLQDKKATFTNVILDESQDLWLPKFHIYGPPAVFVFNRQGKWTQFKYDRVYGRVEKLVAEQLRAP